MIYVLTHALREVLVRSNPNNNNNDNNSTANQKGSLVEKHKICYLWNCLLTPNELAHIEQFCNNYIKELVPKDVPPT